MWFLIEVENNLFAGFSLFDMGAATKDGNLKGYQVDDYIDVPNFKEMNQCAIIWLMIKNAGIL